MILRSLVSVFILVTCCIGISIDIFPKPDAIGNMGGNLTITSTIIKTPVESWYSFVFLVNRKACFTTFLQTSPPCKHTFNDCPGFGHTCNFTHFNVLITGVKMSHDETTVQGKLSASSTGIPLFTNTTTVKVYVPLRSVQLTPNGTLTTLESQLVVFHCSASSIPKATIIWKLDGSTVATVPPTGDDKQRVTSNYTYTANRINNGHTLSCSVDNIIASLTADVTLDITYKPVVTIDSTYNPYNIVENTTNIQIHCDVIQTNPDVNSYSWYKNGAMLTTDSSILTISKVLVSDNGSYTCAATNDVGISDNSWPLILNVLYGVIVESIPKQQLKEGTLLSVNCDGQSYPAVSDNDVIWSKQNNNTFYRTGKSLSIYKTNRLDSGTYICTITLTLISSTGHTVTVGGSTTVDVDVLHKPVVTINSTYNPYNVIENSTSIKLICILKNTNPAVQSYVWQKNGANLSTDDPIYTIKTVKQNDHGNYTCAAINAIGISDVSSPVQLNVLHGVTMKYIDKHQVIEGQNMSVYCDGQSNPPFLNENVKWSKQWNNAFHRSGKQLLIVDVKRQDSGTYTCTVNLTLIPSYGQSLTVVGSTTVVVDVLYKPEVTIYSTTNPFNVIENTTNIQLLCNVTDANPSASSYAWYKDGSQLETNYSTFNISNVQIKDGGSYACVANNSAGSSNTSNAVHFVVLFGVKVDSIMNQNLTEETKLFVSCNGQSYPPFSGDDVVWSKKNNNTFRRTGKDLNITKISRLDNGTFICTVALNLTDSTGHSLTVRGSTAVEINVLYRPVVSIIPNNKVYQVKENATNLKLKCEVLEANPNIISFSWYKDDILLLPTTSDYTIKEVNRSNAGSYACYGKNDVGLSDASSQLELDVLYGVSLMLNPSIIRVNESESWNITCTSSGNPVPTTTLLYLYNNSILIEKNATKISLSTTSATCMDTGIYKCVGINGIEDFVSKSIDVFVGCKPRPQDNIQIKDVFINGTEDSLKIHAVFISNPVSYVNWTIELTNNSLTNLDDTFNVSKLPSVLPFKTRSFLYKAYLAQDEFGNYTATASNAFGSYSIVYRVISARKPDWATDIVVQCHVTSIQVTWISRFNGGDQQTFNVYIANYYTNKTTIAKNIQDIGEGRNITFEETSLIPKTKYLVYVTSNNAYGSTKSRETVNCTTDSQNESHSTSPSALIGGVAGSISAILMIAIVAGSIFVYHRRSVLDEDKDQIKRNTKQTDEDDDGLKDNPLYIQSQDISNSGNGTTYSMVNKRNNKSKENEEQGPIYSQVQKTNKKGGKNKDIEMGSVYENSNKLFTRNVKGELYANTEGGQEQIPDKAKENINKSNKNKDGLIYADLDLAPGPSGNKFIIRGLENRSNYAIIDLTKTAEPLPSDEEDDQKDEETDEHNN